MEGQAIYISTVNREKRGTKNTKLIDVLNINTSAVTDSIVNGINTITTDNLTMSFPLTFEPRSPLYCPVSSFTIAEMRIYVTDSLGRPINFEVIDWFINFNTSAYVI